MRMATINKNPRDEAMASPPVRRAGQNEMSRGRFWLFRSGKGQSMIEFALTFPLVVMLIVAALEMGFYLYDYENLVTATRAAARAGAVYLNETNCPNNDQNRLDGTGCTTPYADNIRATLNRTLGPRLGSVTNVSVTYFQATPWVSTRQGDRMQVDVSYQHRMLTGLAGSVTIPLSARATARIE